MKPSSTCLKVNIELVVCSGSITFDGIAKQVLDELPRQFVDFMVRNKLKPNPPRGPQSAIFRFCGFVISFIHQGVGVRALSPRSFDHRHVLYAPSDNCLYEALMKSSTNELTHRSLRDLFEARVIYVLFTENLLTQLQKHDSHEMDAVVTHLRIAVELKERVVPVVFNIGELESAIQSIPASVDAARSNEEALACMHLYHVHRSHGTMPLQRILSELFINNQATTIRSYGECTDLVSSFAAHDREAFQSN